MKIYTVVASYRSPPCSLLLRWLKENNVEWVVGSQEYGIDVARNQNVTRFLKEAVPLGHSHLLMIDGDTIPENRNILEVLGETVWLAYVGHQGTKGHVDTFGAGACRIAASVFEGIRQPWFLTAYNETVTQRVACECSTFAAKLHQRPKLVGQAGHQQGGDTGPVLWPDGRMTWPAFGG